MRQWMTAIQQVIADNISLKTYDYWKEKEKEKT